MGVSAFVECCGRHYDYATCVCSAQSVSNLRMNELDFEIHGFGSKARGPEFHFVMVE